MLSKEVKMKVNPIINPTSFQKPVFKGYTMDARTPWGTLSPDHLNAGMRTGRPYEKTRDSFHSKETGLIYYADPMEQVSDSIREKVDYVFYDVEPKFPDIEYQTSKIYFFPPNTDHESFRDKVEDFRQYFYRLEMADRKVLPQYGVGEKANYYSSRIADAQYNQETAAGCEHIYDEAFDLICKKNTTYYQIGSIQDLIKQRNLEIPKAEKELEQRKQLGKILEAKIASLKTKQAAYLKFDKSLESSLTQDETNLAFTKEAIEYNTANHPHTQSFFSFTDFLARPISTEGYKNVNSQLSDDNSFEQKEKSQIASNLKRLQASLNKYEKELENNTIYLKKVGDYLKDLPSIIKNLEKELVETKALYERTKAELIPHFDKLKNYFHSRGIRVIR